MIQLVILGNINKHKGGVFELESDKSGRLDTFNWNDLFLCPLYLNMIFFGVDGYPQDEYIQLEINCNHCYRFS